MTFETFFSDEYTLRKQSTEHYIRDPRFEAHGAAIKWSKNHAAKWYDGKELRYVLREEDWSDVFLVCHHSQFDAFILSYHYDVHPKMCGCTLSMARLLLGNHIGVSLDSVRAQFGIPAKSTPYNLFRGLHWNEINEPNRGLVADGACDEVESIWKLFNILGKDFPREELQVVDTIVKMFTEPVLGADIDMLAKLWESENTKKQTAMAELGVTEAELQSADKFIALLGAEGVEVEYKPGKPKDGKEKLIPAIAKTDEFMRGLLEDDNDRIRTLAETRLGVKSTILQTRAETLGWMARRGPLPVYLRYAGAGTLRVAGGDKANWLNFKRGSVIRRAILAPDGYLLAPIDSSQIEFRVAHYLAAGADAPPLVKLRNGEDPYSDTASLFYNEPIYKPAKDDPRRAELEAKRGAGKQANLMGIYGSAAPKYRATAKAGLYGPPIDMSLEEAQRHITIFRDSTPWICAKNTGYWAEAGRMLARLAGGEPLQWGPLLIKDHRIYMPNGCPILYDTLEYHVPESDELESCKEFETRGWWRMKTRQGWKKMWGSKLTQNICEGVSRVIVSQAMNRITAMGYRVLNWPYDELLTLIPKDGKEEWHLQRCVAEMKREVPWLPGLPLDCEAQLSGRYSK